MDILQLRTFLSVAANGSYASTARELYTTRQAISHSIHTLEDELGTKLFIYNNKNLQLTEDGKLLKSHAAKAVASFDSLTREFNRISTGKRLPIALCVDTTLVATALPSIIAYRNQRNLSADAISITQADCELCVSNVQNGLVDACLIKVEQRDFQQLKTITFESNQLSFFVPRNNPLATKNALSIADLDGQSIIVPTDFEYRFKELIKMASSLSVSFDATMRIDLDNVARDIASHNNSIAVAARAADDGRFDKGLFKILPLEDGLPLCEYFCYRRDSQREKELVELGANLSTAPQQ